MINILKIFQGLKPPQSTKSNIYVAHPIYKNSPHRIAKNVNGNPCLLIAVKDSITSYSKNLRLYNLSIVHDLECSVESEGEISKERFTMIEYIGSSELNELFLKTCELIINSLGKTPTRRDINSVTEKFITLFKSFQHIPGKTIQGLWAELFLIDQAPDPNKIVSSWHAIPEERYDFSSNNIRLEVKSNSQRQRSHYFSFEQLTPPQNTNLYIVSIFCEKLAGGVSIKELVESISKKIKAEPKLLEKVHLISHSLLGSNVQSASEVKFDYKLALDSMCFFDYRDVPRVDDIPKNVSEIKFKSSLENLSPIEKHIIWNNI